MTASHLFFHLITYYTAWFACILFAANHIPFVGAFMAFVIFLAQILWQKKYDQTQSFYSFVSMLTMTGFCIDTLFLNAHLIAFKTNPWPIAISPPWMIMLWVNFAVLLYACVRHLFKYPIILGCLSFFGFPMAYYSGVLLGAASLPLGPIGLLGYGFFWALSLPILITIHTKMKRNET